MHSILCELTLVTRLMVGFDPDRKAVILVLNSGHVSFSPENENFGGLTAQMASIFLINALASIFLIVVLLMKGKGLQIVKNLQVVKMLGF